MLNKKLSLGSFVAIASVLGVAALSACAKKTDGPYQHVEIEPQSTSTLESLQEDFVEEEDDSLAELDESAPVPARLLPAVHAAQAGSGYALEAFYLKYLFVSANVTEVSPQGTRTLERGYGRIPQRLKLSENEHEDRSTLYMSVYAKASEQNRQAIASYIDLARGDDGRFVSSNPDASVETCRSLLGIASRSPVRMTGADEGSVELSPDQSQLTLRFSCDMGRGRTRQYELVYGNPVVQQR